MITGVQESKVKVNGAYGQTMANIPIYFGGDRSKVKVIVTWYI